MGGADTVFVGGTLLLDGSPRRGGIVIRDGRIAFVCPAEEIGSTRVVATYVEGKSVFRAGSG